LVQLRKLRELAETRISVKSIRQSVDAMQKVAGLSNPLLEVAVVARGSRLAFRQGGALVDPMTRQMAFDFELTPTAGLAVVRRARVDPNAQAAEVQEMFLRAVRLEENAATLAEAKSIYGAILEIDPDHAAAAINLGTIQYNERDFDHAETLYRRATEADPDAHYNLALAYERMQEPRRALTHWTRYIQLDPSGPWASHAKAQAKRILGSERLAIVTRHGRTMRVR
jgi:tetratricopeptide (TPR) repeat protein